MADSPLIRLAVKASEVPLFLLVGVILLFYDVWLDLKQHVLPAHASVEAGAFRLVTLVLRKL